MLFGQLNKLPIFVLLHTLAVVHAIPLLDKEPLSLSLPPQRLDRRAAPINFKSCSSGEITLINGHLDDMQEMARAAASHAYVSPSQAKPQHLSHKTKENQ